MTSGQLVNMERVLVSLTHQDFSQGQDSLAAPLTPFTGRSPKHWNRPRAETCWDTSSTLQQDKHLFWVWAVSKFGYKMINNGDFRGEGE